VAEVPLLRTFSNAGVIDRGLPEGLVQSMGLLAQPRDLVISSIVAEAS